MTQILTWLIVTIFALVACSPAAAPTPTTNPANPPASTQAIAPIATTPPETETAAITEEAAAVMNMTDASAMTVDYNAPAWASLELVNARTGETFRLSDFAGKTVFVEPMATWCSNCRRQLGNVAAAYAQLDSEQVVFIALSVAEQVDNATLAAYADQNGWNWVFAVATPELTQALVDTFTRSVITPPSTPHFTIAPNGTVSGLSTGFHSPDALIAEITAITG